jgi:hypothetical protein
VPAQGRIRTKSTRATKTQHTAGDGSAAGSAAGNETTEGDGDSGAMVFKFVCMFCDIMSVCF